MIVSGQCNHAVAFFSIAKLDCNDHLYVYDGAHAVGTHKVSSNGIEIFILHG